MPSMEETLVETELSYGAAGPVQVLVRKRGRRYDIQDRGVAVRAAGRPPGWLAVSERVVAADGMNVNRAGVVFVPAVEGRDITRLAMRLAETSLAVHHALLELDAGNRVTVR